MKKINKLALSLGTMTAVAAPIAAVISCGSDDKSGKSTSYGNTDKNEKVAFITDSGIVEDKSFNEGTLEGVKAYATGANSKTYRVYEVQNEGHSHQDFVNQYNAAKNSGAQSFVLPGFRHGPFDNGKFKIWWEAQKLTAKPVVGVDLSDNVDDNFYGLTFKTEQSGFLAAVHMGFALNKKLGGTADHVETYKVATFGGMSILSVTQYMNGFDQGIKWFNDNKGSDLNGLDLIHSHAGNQGDFSGSFEPGAGRRLADYFLEHGAKAIFPVAGPQGKDVHQSILYHGKQNQAFLIGVDTDQSKIFGNTVLTSAIKGIKAATLDTLNAIDSNTAVDKQYSLSDNTSGVQFIGAIDNAHLDLSAYSAKMAAAEGEAINATPSGLYHPEKH